MQRTPIRIRRGELIAGISAALLVALLFLVPWFRFGSGVSRVGAGVGRVGSGVGRVGSDLDGWHGLPTLRWLILVAAFTGLALLFFQATRRAPALPVALSVIVTTLGALTTLALIIRLPTDSGSPLAGAFLGLLAAAALTAGAFMSLRQEDGWVPDQDHPIETIVIGPPTHP
jgi:hypothetical protein